MRSSSLKQFLQFLVRRESSSFLFVQMGNADTPLQVVVSPFLGVVYDKVASYLTTRFGQIWGVEEEMEKFSRTLFAIKTVLSDAEEKQVTYAGPTRDWLQELKDATYEAYDVLDEWETEDPRRTDSFFCRMAATFTEIKFRHIIATDIKKLTKRFDSIAEEKGRFHLQMGTVEFEVYPGSGTRETGSILTEPQVYERDDDKEELVKLLLKNENGEEAISIWPILGMGGLGKTTLARMVYNDKRVADHFIVRSWVCVSGDFDIKRLLKAIVASLSGNTCALEELDLLQQRLQKELGGRRFLLVLDDVWEENQEKWEKLKGSLMNGGVKGSSFIVTTRLETVASINGAVSPYRLKLLSDGACRSLFEQYAFGMGNEKRRALEDISKEIVAKCGGLPLAAKALGELLRFKCDESEWLSVSVSNIWELRQGNTEIAIFPTLRLSYAHLQSHVKQCLVYCSIFPKDYRMERQRLIQLWIANGLVPSQLTMDLEDAGNVIFNGLLQRSFFQDMEKDEDGNIKMCKMHSLVHELTCCIAAEEYSRPGAAGSMGSITGRTRHVSLDFTHFTPSAILGSRKAPAPCLRSLISLKIGVQSVLSIENAQGIFSRLIRLRALDLSWTSIDAIPNSIRKMKHLRYFNLSRTRIKSLPESICLLRNVETLKLEGCKGLKMLPNGIGNMSSLVNLDITACKNLTEMPIRMGALTSLRTLSFFIVGLNLGHSIKELQRLNHLGGELKITRLEHVINRMDAAGANLTEKKNLCSLELSWSDPQLQGNASQVIEGLQPHSGLRRLFLDSYPGETFPSWLKVSSLPNLVEISFSKCRNCERLPPLPQLPILKVLTLNSMNSIKFIDEEVYASTVSRFPSLEVLHLFMMPNLEGWSQVAEAVAGPLLPGLKRLILMKCPKVTGVLSSSPVQSVKVQGCSEMLLGSLQNLPHLSSLEISACNYYSFPQGTLENLTALTNLWIYNCKELNSLPGEMRYLSSLETLTISRCHSLQSLPVLEMSSLVHLTIEDCRELEFSAEDFQYLVLLQELKLENLPRLTCFPEGVKQAVMLRSLKVQYCSEMVDLPDWIGTLALLQNLTIRGCKNRKELPEGMEQLTALRELIIIGCDAELERRCEKDSGDEWLKIRHVPHVFISNDL